MEGSPVEMLYDAALEAFLAQCDFCRREGSRFRKCGNVGMNSCMFYENKVQELKWEIHQLQNQYEDSNEMITLHRLPIQVPVSDENENLGEHQMELSVNELVYLPQYPSKKTYHFRYVVCLPLQKRVLQEAKTELFKQSEVEKVQKRTSFEYPRSDEKIKDSLRRGYLAIELYAGRKLKSPYLIGATRVPLSPLLTQDTLVGTARLGERETGGDALWDLGYSVTIRRPQTKDARENFSLVEKSWLALSLGQDKTKEARRSSIACMNAKLNHRNKKSRRHSHSHMKSLPDNLVAFVPQEKTPEEAEEEEEKSDKVLDTLELEKLNTGKTAAKVKKTLTRKLSSIF